VKNIIISFHNQRIPDGARYHVARLPTSACPRDSEPKYGGAARPHTQTGSNPYKLEDVDLFRKEKQ